MDTHSIVMILFIYAFLIITAIWCCAYIATEEHKEIKEELRKIKRLMDEMNRNGKG